MSQTNNEQQNDDGAQGGDGGQNDQQQNDQQQQEQPHGDQQQQGDQQPAGGQSTEEDSTDWKAEARKWEKQSKANVEKAKRTEQLEAENAALRKENDELKGDKLRTEVAEAKSKAAGFPIPAAMLKGSTKAELEAYADQLIEFKGGKPRKFPSSDGQGNSGGDVHDKGNRSAVDVVDAATGRA